MNEVYVEVALDLALLISSPLSLFFLLFFFFFVTGPSIFRRRDPCSAQRLTMA